MQGKQTSCLWAVCGLCVTFDLIQLQLKLGRAVDLLKTTQLKTKWIIELYLSHSISFLTENNWELDTKLSVLGSILWLP